MEFHGIIVEFLWKFHGIFVDTSWELLKILSFNWNATQLFNEHQRMNYKHKLFKEGLSLSLYVRVYIERIAS